jgi:hypothetical protein
VARLALLLLGLAAGTLLAVAAASRGGGEAPTTDAASNVAAIKAVRGPYEGRIGVSGSVVWYDSAEQFAFLRKARETGLSWLREDFHWGEFEPKRATGTGRSAIA